MLNKKQRKAVRLLYEMPDDRVAEELGVQMDTLRRWKGQKEFIEAMAAKARESQECIRRITADIVAHGAIRFRELLTSEDSKVDPKILCDLVKASGALATVAKSDEGAQDLDAIMARIMSDPDHAAQPP